MLAYRCDRRIDGLSPLWRGCSARVINRNGWSPSGIVTRTPPPKRIQTLSIEAMSWALDQPIGGTSKIVLIGIASHADKYGRNAWPSVPTLSTYANVDARSVQRALTDLINRGYLEREFQAGGTRYTVDELRPNLYHLNLGKKDAPGDTGVTPPR